MEFHEVLHKRKMYRKFSSESVDTDALKRILNSATKGPSAGYSQGFDFLVLTDKQELQSFWNLALTNDWRERTTSHNGLWNAPVIVIPLANSEAYVKRYSEADKSYSNLKSVDDWPVPYWYIDCAFATMLLLTSVTNEGLGALFFGLFRNVAQIKNHFQIPSEYSPIGAIAIGHPIDSEHAQALPYPKRSTTDQFHFNKFGQSEQ